jgi:hypothetical protein
MTPQQLEILQHALGVDEYGRSPRGFSDFTRNYICADGEDEQTCRELVAIGLMAQRRTTESFPYFNCVVTDEGIAAMRKESPQAPKISRARQRYLDFLDWADAYGGTFRDYLRWRKETPEALR